MQTTTLGCTNIHVSRIGFGGLPIQRLSEEAAVTLIKRAIDLGINLFDTAAKYGKSEEYIGKAIKGYDREKLIIITKASANNYDEVKKKIHISISHLQTDYIDIYEFHNLADRKLLDRVLHENGVMEALIDAKKEGIIKHIGITSHNPDTAIEAIKSEQFEIMMFPLDFVAYDYGHTVLSACRQYNIDFLAMKPLAGGALGENVDLALRFLLEIADVLPVVGIETTKELEQIIAIEQTSKKLTLQERKKIHEIRCDLGTKFCRRCGYCLPCPQEIPISLINNLSTFINREIPSIIFTSGRVTAGVDKARNCADCGECEDKCPYNLSIRELLKHNIEIFDKAKQCYLKKQEIL